MTKEEIAVIQNTLHEIAVKVDSMKDWMYQQSLIEDMRNDLNKITKDRNFLKNNAYISAECYLRLIGGNATGKDLDFYIESACEFSTEKGYPVIEYMDGDKPVKLFRYVVLDEFVMF